MEKAKLLALFFNKARYENSPKILFKLDKLHSKVYQKNRITAPGGFEEATIMANEAVINKVLKDKKLT